MHYIWGHNGTVYTVRVIRQKHSPPSLPCFRGHNTVTELRPLASTTCFFSLGRFYGSTAVDRYIPPPLAENIIMFNLHIYTATVLTFPYRVVVYLYCRPTLQKKKNGVLLEPTPRGQKRVLRNPSPGRFSTDISSAQCS